LHTHVWLVRTEFVLESAEERPAPLRML